MIRCLIVPLGSTVLVLLGAGGCASDETDRTLPDGGAPPTEFGGDRPVELKVPDSYDPAVPTPLLLLLHGYGAAGIAQDVYLQVGAHALPRGFLYAHPDGTFDQDGKRFWNATDACCDFDGSGVDDSGYLQQLVADIRQHYNVDPQRIYFTGHSNGGFMSYRMACDHADWIAAIASLAGATYLDAERCGPVAPVHVLHIHGTEDDAVLYEGGPTERLGAYPGAVASVEQWASFAGCSLTPDTSAEPLDLDAAVAGAETTVGRYDQGCAAGGSAELWSIVGGGHLPAPTGTFMPALLDYLLAHPKP